MSDLLLLARPLPGTCGERNRVVHFFSLAPGRIPNEIKALCGIEFEVAALEVMQCLRGMPCEACLIRTRQQRRIEG